MQISTRQYVLGCIFVIIGGICYALGGTCGQYLFMHNNMVSEWLVPVRMLVSGIVLLITDKFVLKHEICKCLTGRRHLMDMAVFAFIGTAFSQFGFYTSIQYANAAFATVLSYASVLFVLIYELTHHKRLPYIAEIISVVLVLIGTFLMCTHGDFSSLIVDPRALFWSIVSASAYALYTVKPARLLRDCSLLSVVGWGLVIAGGFLSIIFRPWNVANIVYDFNLLAFMSGVIVIGTILSFTFFLGGVKIVGGVIGSVLSAIDPVVSCLVCLYALGINLVWQDFLGMTIVVLSIFILALSKKSRQQAK